MRPTSRPTTARPAQSGVELQMDVTDFGAGAAGTNVATSLRGPSATADMFVSRPVALPEPVPCQPEKAHPSAATATS
jgi:hypothetical protein